MRVSQRLDYALRGLVALAQRPEGSAVAASDIADRLSLPRRFLEQQFTALAKAGLVESRRGSGGGCRLARPAREITVADVVRAIEGVTLDVPRTSGTVISEMWEDVARSMEQVLGDVDLAELAERQDRLDAGSEAIYYI
jgi:Rrf2 family protein